MKKRMTKVLALGMMAAMLISAPLSAMAAEVAPADAAATAETQPEMAMQAAEEEAAVTALTNGVDPMALDGLVQLNDGNWYYMEDGRLSSNASKTVKPACGSWWYVSGWKIDFSFTGFGKNGDDLWYVKDGQVQFGYTGVARGTDQYGNTSTYYVTNGRVDKSFRGLAYGIYNGEEGWINFCDGKPKYSYESLVEYNGAWWKMSGYMIDFDYTGAASNEAGTWYVRNGQVDETVNGVYQYTVNGKTAWHGLWRGKKAYNEVLMNPNDGSWWYVRDGLVDFSYTGMGTRHDWTGDTSDTWYIRNGQVDFSYSGCVAADGNTRYWRRYYLVENGRLRKEVSGLVQATVEGVNGWWKIDQGVITVQSGGSETFLVYYNGDWWYVLNSGQVDFSFTGLKGYNGETWYVENGRVNFDKTGFVNLSGDTTTRYTYIQNGHPLPYGFSGLFYAELDGKTTWWQIEEGHCDYYGGPEPSHYERPESFAANEEGLWATNNSQISYGITGVYKTIGRIGYSSSYSIEVEYTYNVVNGLVTEMQAVIL